MKDDQAYGVNGEDGAGFGEVGDVDMEGSNIHQPSWLPFLLPLARNISSFLWRPSFYQSSQVTSFTRHQAWLQQLKTTLSEMHLISSLPHRRAPSQLGMAPASRAEVRTEQVQVVQNTVLEAVLPRLLGTYLPSHINPPVVEVIMFFFDHNT